MNVRNELTYLEEVIQRRNERIEELESRLSEITDELKWMKSIYPNHPDYPGKTNNHSTREVNSDER